MSEPPANTRPVLLPVGHCFGHKPPEFRAVVHFLEMAELVHNDVVALLRREEEDLVTEVEVALARTAPPSPLRVFYGNSVVCKSIACVEMPEPGVGQDAGCFLVLEIVLSGQARPEELFEYEKRQVLHGLLSEGFFECCGGGSDRGGEFRFCGCYFFVACAGKLAESFA